MNSIDHPGSGFGPPMRSKSPTRSMSLTCAIHEACRRNTAHSSPKRSVFWLTFASLRTRWRHESRTQPVYMYCRPGGCRRPAGAPLPPARSAWRTSLAPASPIAGPSATGPRTAPTGSGACSSRPSGAGCWSSTTPTTSRCWPRPPSSRPRASAQPGRAPRPPGDGRGHRALPPGRPPGGDVRARLPLTRPAGRLPAGCRLLKHGPAVSGRMLGAG